MKQCSPLKSVNCRTPFLIIIGLLLLALILWLCRRQPEQSPAASSNASVTPNRQSHIPFTKTPASDSDAADEAKAEAPVRAMVAAAYNTPIKFWGKAVDETGQPVAGASVHYVASDKFFGDGSDYDSTTDANGLFSLTGVKGLSLSVRVEKTGYYQIENQSYKLVAFGYTTPAKDVFPAPTKDKPTVFVLRTVKANPALIRGSGWQLIVPQDGHAVEVRLEGKKSRAQAGGGHFIVETNLDLGKLNSRNEFPWRFRISVPGGGLLERKSALDFEAPVNGYTAEEVVEAKLPQGPNEHWNPRIERDYFIKLASGHYGRLHLEVHISDLARKNSIYYEGAWDPSGSRNLEIGADDIGNPR